MRILDQHNWEDNTMHHEMMIHTRAIAQQEEGLGAPLKLNFWGLDPPTFERAKLMS